MEIPAGVEDPAVQSDDEGDDDSPAPYYPRRIAGESARDASRLVLPAATIRAELFRWRTRGPRRAQACTCCAGAVTRIEAVISDFGGVLTSPLLDSFVAFERSSGISGEELGKAIGAIWERGGANPLFELETGRMTEASFLKQLGDELTAALGREIHMRSFTRGVTSSTCARTSA